MNKIIAAIFITVILGGFLFVNVKKDTQQKSVLSGASVKPSAMPTQPVIKQQLSLFVPYWSMSNTIEGDGYDRLIYFGIAVNQNGIDTNDPGYKNLALFNRSISQNKEKVLVLRMIDQKNNFAVLANKNLQEKITSQAALLAKQQGFSEIVLDLELSSLPFNSVVDQINNYVELLHKTVQENNLRFGMTLYGDTFYRIRPYDVVSLVKNCDEIFVMSYDFHKANGDPGPNFPFNGKEKYGYDFKTMIADFLNIVPKEKLTIVFGLFGYDWTVDDLGKAIGQATPLSFNDAKKKFLDACDFKNCVVKQDTLSKETEVKYVDSSNQNHIVWFETMESVAAKKAYLKEKGINSVSFWAYSYF